VSTHAQWLREIADQVEAGNLSLAPRLVPLPASEVVVGDLIRTHVHTTLKVDQVEVAKECADRLGGNLLRFTGIKIISPTYEGVESTHIAYADEWVVVER
jgi:hypothetical protein